MLSKVLITGSCGYSGARIARYFCEIASVWGIDPGCQNPVIHPNYVQLNSDLRFFDAIDQIVESHRPELIVQCLQSQPCSWRQFQMNVVGAANILEAIRWHSPASVFVLLSPNPLPALGQLTTDLVKEYSEAFRIAAFSLAPGEDDPNVIASLYYNVIGLKE